MNLYFIGGGSVEQGELVRIDRAILSDIGVPHPVVLVIPWTDPDTKRRRLYEAMLGEYFVCLGAGKVIFARLRDSHQTLRNKFGEADQFLWETRRRQQRRGAGHVQEGGSDVGRMRRRGEDRAGLRPRGFLRRGALRPVGRRGTDGTLEEPSHLRGAGAFLPVLPRQEIERDGEAMALQERAESAGVPAGGAEGEEMTDRCGMRFAKGCCAVHCRVRAVLQ
jgi:hypothetical protein